MSQNDLLRMAWAQFWQLTALVIVVMILVRILGRNRPHLAHVLWLVVLLKCVTPPVWTSRSSVFCWLQHSSPQPILKEAAVDLPPIVVDLQIEPSHSSPLEEPRLEATRTGAFSPPPQSIRHVATATHAMTWTPAFVAWAAGVALVVLVATVRWFRSWRSICTSTTEERNDLQGLLIDLARRLKINRRLRLLVTTSRIGPAVVGIWRPTLLLPTAVVNGKSAADLEPILAHELVHVRRGDLWIGLLQLIAQSLWWFHPLVWLANRLLARDAERCCDEEVIAELGCDPAKYARCLLDVLELKRTLQPVPAFPGVRPVEITSRRLERIMKLGHGCHKRTPWWCWLILAVVAAVTLPGAAIITAGDEPKKAEEKRIEKSDLPQKSPAMYSTWTPSPAKPASSSPPGQTPTHGKEQAVETHTYLAHDALTRIQQDLRDTEPGTKQLLEQLLRSIARCDGQEPRFIWAEDQLVAQHTSDGHKRIASGLEFFAQNGAQQLRFEIFVISGHPNSVDKLHSDWEVMAPDLPELQPGNLLPSPKLPPEIIRSTHAGSPTASVAEVIEKQKPALFAVLEQEKADSILDAVRADRKLLIVTAPKVVTFTGQPAIIQSISQRPFVVGFKKTQANDYEPQIRVVPSGWDMQLLPLPHSKDHVRLECQLELSDIRSVEEHKLKLNPKREPLVIQIPETVATKINLAYDLPLGQTLLVGGLHNTTPEGKPLSTLMMLHCAAIDVPSQLRSDSLNKVLPNPQTSSETKTHKDLAVPPVPGPYSDPTKGTPAPTPARTVSQILKAKISLSIKDATLDELITAIRKTCHLKIDVDVNALRREGVDLTKTASVDVTDIEVREALRMILKRSQLTYVVRDDQVIVTTQKAVTYSPRIYHVADLAMPARPVFVEYSGGRWSDSKRTATKLRKDDSNQKPDFATLIELIKGIIEPGSWSPNADGAIEEFPTNLSLVISQTEDVHKRISQFLDNLRSTQLQIAMELRIIGLTTNDSFKALSPEPESSQQTDPTLIQLSDRHARILLQAAQHDPAAKVSDAIKLTVSNCQPGNIIFGNEDSQTYLQLLPISKNRQTIDLRYRIGTTIENNATLHALTPNLIANGNTVVVDVTKSISPKILGDASAEEIPLLGQLPHLGALFRKAQEKPIEQVYLLVTPRILELPEDDAAAKLGILPSAARRMSQDSASFNYWHGFVH